MSEHENDGFYWVPDPGDDLRQGDLLFNVPVALMPQRPRFVLGAGEQVQTETFDDYPENAPSSDIVVEARFGVLSMGVTPTCHVADGEKDEDVVAVVPVDALNLVVPDLTEARNIRAGKNVPLHMFPLPKTDLDDGVLRFNGVALLDRPTSLLKDDLREYRRLGLYVDRRIQLRKALARFWARGSADDSIERDATADRDAATRGARVAHYGRDRRRSSFLTGLGQQLHVLDARAPRTRARADRTNPGVQRARDGLRGCARCSTGDRYRGGGGRLDNGPVRRPGRTSSMRPQSSPPAWRRSSRRASITPWRRCARTDHRASRNRGRLRQRAALLGMMPGTRRAEDLRRVPRIAIHSQVVDPREGDPGAWSGEVKLSGRAVKLATGAEGASDRFRVAVADVVLTRVGTPANHLVIERWNPDGGLVRRERH
jgi:hypothetical protein